MAPAVRLLRDRDRVINPAQRNDTHRTAGAMNHLDVAREQILDAILKDSVRMATADFHQLQRLTRQVLNLVSQFERQAALSVFVNEFHFELPLKAGV